MQQRTCHGRGPDSLATAYQPAQGVCRVSGGEGRSANVAVEGTVVQPSAGQGQVGRRRVVRHEGPGGRLPPGEEGEGHGQFSAGGRRGKEVLREGAKRGQVTIAAWPRTREAKAIVEPAECLVAGFAGQPNAQCVAVRIGLRWDRNKATRAVMTGGRAEVGRARQAAVAGGAVGPAPQPTIDDHAR